ncbi:MAG: hypothetical protein PVF48_14985, partial [Syntrophobacterales bacterium]
HIYDRHCTFSSWDVFKMLILQRTNLWTIAMCRMYRTTAIQQNCQPDNKNHAFDMDKHLRTCLVL